MLSFGGSGDKLLAVATNEDPMNLHSMHLYYFTGAGTGAHPTSSTSFETIVSGLYIIICITNDPLNNDIAYIFYN
jgi:hypothetical protein